MDANAAIQVIGLGKQFGTNWAIRGLEFDVKKGEIFGFLGPNGAGKTTTIRTLMNFIAPSKGIAMILGMDSQDQPVQIHKQVGYITGDMSYYKNLTGRQYLLYMSNLQGGVATKDINRLARRLKAELHTKIHQLSRGNVEKIGLIGAFMHKPNLLIMDEPSTGLDPLLQSEFHKLMREHREKGGTAFISSHFLAEVEQICDRVGFIHRGEIQEVLDLQQLRDRSVREFFVTFDKPATKNMLAGVRGVHELELSGNRMHCHVAGSVDHFVKAIARNNVVNLQSRELDLQEVFLKLYKKR